MKEVFRAIKKKKNSTGLKKRKTLFRLVGLSKKKLSKIIMYLDWIISDLLKA